MGNLRDAIRRARVQIPFRAAEPCDLPERRLAQYGQVAERFSRGRGDQCLGDSRSKVMVLSWVISRREYIPPMRPVPLRVPVKPPAGVWGCQ